MTDTLTKLKAHMAAMRSKQPMVYLDWDQLEALIECAEALGPLMKHCARELGDDVLGGAAYTEAKAALKSLNEVSA